MCCVIVRRLRGKNVPVGDLYEAYEQNPDGAGMCWIDKRGRTRATKWMWSFNEMIDRWDDLVAEDLEFALHLRVATHGDIDDANCHPFSCGEYVWLMHNGILRIETPRVDRSDTWHFAQKLSKLGHVESRLRARGNLAKLEKWHGSGNKLLFCTPGGFIRTGNWYQYMGCWWSNLYWRPKAWSWLAKKDQDADDWGRGWYYLKEEDDEKTADYDTAAGVGRRLRDGRGVRQKLAYQKGT